MDIVVKTNKKIKKLGLALGGGGTRGFALIGALKAFEENNINFDYIAGTSVGSLAGALFCAGLTSDEILNIALSLKEKDIKKSFIPFAPSSTEGIQNIIKNTIGDIEFSDLKKEFCAVAVDIKTGEEVYITEGNLAKAVAGSCAVPGVFFPVEFDKYLLFDGGLQNTIPTNVPKLHKCQITIGVDINSSRGTGTNSEKYFDMLKQSISIMMKGNTIKGYLNADIMIQPDMKRFRSSKLDGAMDMYNEGYRAAVEKMPEILAVFEKRKKKRKFSEFFKFWAKEKNIESKNI